MNIDLIFLSSNQITTMNQNTLNILDLRIWVHLGCSDEEKFHPQIVNFDVEVIFNSIPQCAINDELKDAVCYLELVEKIKFYCKNKKFNLIEHLAYNIHKDVLAPLIAKNSDVLEIKLSIKKISPTVEGVHGGVVFKLNNLQW